jgi:hypothetical protein
MALRTADHTRSQHERVGNYAGYEVRDPLGNRIGIAEEVFADLNDEPRYLKVKVGALGVRSALIPVRLFAADTRRRVLELR